MMRWRRRLLWFVAGIVAVVVVGSLLVVGYLAAHRAPVVPLRAGAVELAGSVMYDGRERPYRLHFPPGYTPEKRYPLVLALHGGGGAGESFDAQTTAGTLSRAADELGVVLCFPEGIERTWLDPRPGSQAPHAVDPGYHVGYFRVLLDHLEGSVGVDPDRVYATGISNGGMMSLMLAIGRSDRVAAVAPVTANLREPQIGLRPEHPVSLLLINGTLDPLVPYDGGEVVVFGKQRGRVVATTQTLAVFREANGCAAEPAVEMLPDADPGDGTRVVQSTWTGGRAVVRLLEVQGGGHTWPGGHAYLGEGMVGKVSRDLDASRVILEFFLAHPRLR